MIWCDRSAAGDAAFAIGAERYLTALMIDGDLVFNVRHDQMVALAAHHKIPASYPYRIFTDAGGLMSYGAVYPEMFRQVGIYVGRILKGDKPSDYLSCSRPSSSWSSISKPQEPSASLCRRHCSFSRTR